MQWHQPQKFYIKSMKLKSESEREKKNESLENKNCLIQLNPVISLLFHDFKNTRCFHHKMCYK